MSNEQRIDDLEVQTKVRRFTMLVAIFGVSILLLCVALIGVGYVKVSSDLHAREKLGDHRWCAIIQVSLRQAVKPEPGQSAAQLAQNRKLVTQLGREFGCIK